MSGVRVFYECCVSVVGVLYECCVNGVQTLNFLKTVQKCKKSIKTVKFRKMMVIFEFPTIKLV